ncbi:PH-interacting protein [Dorcoceras hygrometricum]|uniref:PH-interacting protein n=1 Tax=Dorcoceras hygrometricum TaxID=472368 RepID=A0A2Z7BNP6_9LAMI|nr:PH-interacting protein [Dorcoceras hygrometricum]
MTPPGEAAEEQKLGRETINTIQNNQSMTIHRVFLRVTFLATRAWLRPVSQGNRHFTVGGGRLCQSGPRPEGRLLRQPALEGLTRSARTDSPLQVGRNNFRRSKVAAAAVRETRRRRRLLGEEGGGHLELGKSHSPKSSSLAQHIELSITDSACKNQLVVVSVQYGPFNPYIPIRSTTIGKSRVAIDPIAMRTSWRSNSDITSVTSIGYPRMSASGESSKTMHRLLHASGSHPIPSPDDPKTNQYNQDLGLIHWINGNHLESSNEGSSIDHQVTIYLHAQNITKFPTNETWYFASQILVSSSDGLILILTAQSTRNMFRIHSDY